MTNEGTTSGRKRWGRRPVVILSLCLLAGLALFLGWYGWRKLNAPLPPEVVLEGDPELMEAVEAARARVKRAPYSADAWGQLAMLLRGVRLVEPAAACFAQAARLEPRNPRWHYLHGEAFLPGDPDSALPHLRRAARLWDQDNPPHVAPWLRLAEVLIARGDLDEAETLLGQALAADPRNPSIHFQFGLLALAREDLPAARSSLLRCQHSPFTRQRAASRLAFVCGRLGKRAEADQFAAAAAALSPDSPWIDPFVAECLQLAVGKTEKLRRAEQMEARGQYQEAVRLLAEVTERSPDYQALVGLGRNLMRIGSLDAAEKALGSVARLDADNLQAHYFLAELAWARDQLSEVIAHADLAIARKSDHALSHLLRGRALRKSGQREQGLQALRTAVRSAPDLFEAQYRLGEALAEDGMKEEARTHLQQAARLAPADPRPGVALEKLR